jgi:hypothetical protein
VYNFEGILNIIANIIKFEAQDQNFREYFKIPLCSFASFFLSTKDTSVAEALLASI